MDCRALSFLVIFFATQVNSSSFHKHRKETKNVPPEVTASKELIAELVSRKFEEDLKLKEMKAMEMGSRARHHEQFSNLYNRLSHEMLQKAREEKASSQKELGKAKSHEKESTEYSTKAKDIIKRAWEQERNEVEFVNNYRKGYWESHIANIKAMEAVTQMKIQENRAKREFIKAAELEKLGNLLAAEAEEYNTLAKLAEEHARKAKSLSENKAEVAKKHHAKAEEYFLKNVVKFKANVRDQYRKYLQNLLQSEKEHELAREEQLKAAYEVKLSNVYVQKAQQNSAFANTAKSRQNEDKVKAKESVAVFYGPRSAEILVSSKTVEEKSVEVISR